MLTGSLADAHGMLKVESSGGVVRPDSTSAKAGLSVPRGRRVRQSRPEATVDAPAYLVESPRGCTEQTPARFLPSVIIQKVLTDVMLDLDDVAKKRVDLNAAGLRDAAGEAGVTRTRLAPAGRRRYPGGAEHALPGSTRGPARQGAGPARTRARGGVPGGADDRPGRGRGGLPPYKGKAVEVDAGLAGEVLARQGLL